MELILFVIGLFVLLTLFMPWINHFRFGSLRDDIAQLQKKVRELEGNLSDSKVKGSPANAPLKQNVKEKREEKVEEKKLIKSSIPRTSNAPKTDWAQKTQSTFEQNIATKLPVWIGAISLICAAFFLVKYSIEHSWLGPMARVSMGAVFGGAILAAGQWIGRREYIANSVRIGQALIGAGLVALYVSVYAAINLYGLLPPLIAFGSMTAITALAVILSIRHGQPIAVFGLLGGLLTPALIGSDEPNALAMFAYLFLIFSGMFIVLVRKGWWVLAVAAVIGVFCWSIFWFLLVFAASDALVLVLFAMAITAVVLVVTGKRVAENTIKEEEKLPIHGLNFTVIAGGVLTIIWLSFEMTLTLFDWSMLGLLSIALIALSYFQPQIYQKPLLAKLGASLLMFFIWAQDAPLGNALAVLFGIGAIYIGLSAVVMRQVKDPRFWAGMQITTAVALFVTSYLALDISEAFLQSFGMFWGIISLVIASLTAYQASDIRDKYTADATIREHLVSIYVLGASAFISIGLVIELPWDYVPLALAGQVAVTAWVYQKTQIDYLKTVMVILAFIFAGLNYEQIFLFLISSMHALMDITSSKNIVSSYVLDMPLIKLGVPSALFFLSLWIIKPFKESNKKTASTISGIATVLAIATIYYVLRGSFQPSYLEVFLKHAGFIERGVITISFAGLGIGLLQLVKRYDLSFLKPWGYGLFHLAIIRLTYFDLMIDNPYWSAQFVGDTPILNGITLTYGAGALLAMWAVYDKGLESLKDAYKAIAFISFFAFVTFTVRQYFHGGNIVEGAVSSAELYTYSVAWLLAGLGLLTFGIMKENKAARMSSMVLIILAVLKVFLFDAAELEGLYRVFSFLGLGVSLIGLSYFYTKFISINEK